MKKIIIVFIFLLLAILVVFEEIYINNALSFLFESATKIQSKTEESDHINTQDILLDVENMEYKWNKYENILCFVFNHKDMEDIGIEITKMKANIAVNQFEDFRASLNLIIFYSKLYTHFMGISLENLL